MRSVKAAATSNEGAPRLRAVEAPRAPSLPVIGIARVHAITAEGVVLDAGEGTVLATLDASVHPSVIAGAHRRGERVIVEQREGRAPVVVGALRAQPTPGIDAADAYVIEAKRISLRADDEVSIGAQAASLVVRAIGEVETYADRIVSRAESVHKIVGRILRLN